MSKEETSASFSVGTKVRTTSENLLVDDWLPEARMHCAWNVEGVIVKESNAHGICYRVRHADGTEAAYDPAELVAI